MFDGLMGKLGDMKSKMAEVKTRLSSVTVKGESSDGQVSVIMDGNKVVKDVIVSYELSNTEKEELQEMILQATNRAIVQAEKMYEAEMAASAKNFLPGFGG